MSNTNTTPAPFTLTADMKAAVVLKGQSKKRCEDAGILADYASDEDMIRAVFTAEQHMHVWKSLGHFPLLTAEQAAKLDKVSLVVINANAAFVVSESGHEWRKGPDGEPYPVPAMLASFPSLKGTGAEKTAKALTRSGGANLKRTKEGETPAQALCRTIARGLRKQKAEAAKQAAKAEAKASATQAKREEPAAVTTPKKAPKKAAPKKAPARKAKKA